MAAILPRYTCFIEIRAPAYDISIFSFAAIHYLHSHIDDATCLLSYAFSATVCDAPKSGLSERWSHAAQRCSGRCSAMVFYVSARVMIQRACCMMALRSTECPACAAAFEARKPAHPLRECRCLLRTPMRYAPKARYSASVEPCRFVRRA